MNKTNKPQAAETVTRTYMDLSLFVVIFEHLHGTGASYGFGYDIGLDCHYLTLSWSRYTMNTHGVHVGYEDYTATLGIVKARGAENTPRAVHELRQWLVDLDSLDNVECQDAPKTEECPCESGDCNCDDDMCCSEDSCDCERYYSPLDGEFDDEYAWAEFRHLVDTVCDYPAHWAYHNNPARWIIETNNGTVLHESDWVPGSLNLR